MATLTSPPSLQHICEATATAWLLYWSATLGEVAAQAAFLEPHVIYRGWPHTLFCSSKILSTKPPEQCHIQSYKNAELHQRDNAEETARPYLSEKCNMKNTSMKYDTQDSLPNLVQDEIHSVARVSIDKLCTTVVKYVSNNVPTSIKQYTHKIEKTTNLKQVYSSSSVCQEVHKKSLKENIRKCSAYLQSIMPSLLIDELLISAWRIVSEQMIINCQDKFVAGVNEDYILNYQLFNWTRRAPVLLSIAANVSNKKFPLNIPNVAVENFHYILNFMHKYLPLEQVNALILPRMRFDLHAQIQPRCFVIFKEILQKTSLVSLTLNSMCDDNTLSLLSQLSLQELNIMSCTAKEESIIKGLCGLPLCTAHDVLNSVAHGDFRLHKLSPLRKSLCRFSISVRVVQNLVYHAILFIFPNLHKYNPHINIIQCIQHYAKACQYLTTCNSCYNLPTLKLERINMGRVSKNEILEISEVCPNVREISVIVELNCRETLCALQICKLLTHIELAYYPSFSSSIPKINGEELIPIIKKFKQQIQHLSLTGFNINSTVLHELSQLPVLKSLELHNSWLSNQQTCPQKPFPCLENLTLQFLPPQYTMQLFTASSNLVKLSFDNIASDWEGNYLTDAHIKHLVTSGMISSVQSFSASSPFLTLSSIKFLSFLPFLRNISHVAHWGLTLEELSCLNHCNPSRVQCIP